MIGVWEVMYISELVSENDSTLHTVMQTGEDLEMTVHNIIPQFKSLCAYEKSKKEISDSLYRIFFKYK